MKTVRDFLQRLRGISVPEGLASLAQRHRRLVVPGATRFAMDDTLFRTAPFEPILPVARPGASSEVPQLLEWLDVVPDGGVSLEDNDLGTDLAAILGLATGRKVAFANEMPLKYEGSAYTWFLETGPAYDSGLYGPVEGDIRAKVIQIVSALDALPEEQAIALGGGIRMRNAACCLVESDYSSAYGLLIAAIETLSRAFGAPPTAWKDWEEADGWDNFMAEELVLSPEAAEKLRARLLLDKQLRLTRTFVEYVVGNLSPSFWSERYFHYEPRFAVDANGVQRDEGSWTDGGPLSVLVPDDLGILRKRLSASYHARSQVFHQSSRLEQIDLLPVPRTDVKAPLSFGALRRILDHLLWKQVDRGAVGGAALPDVRVLHRMPDKQT